MRENSSFFINFFKFKEGDFVILITILFCLSYYFLNIKLIEIFRTGRRKLLFFNNECFELFEANIYKLSQPFKVG